MSEFKHLSTVKLSAAIDRYVMSLQMRNCSPRTIEANTGTLSRFDRWCQEPALAARTI